MTAYSKRIFFIAVLGLALHLDHSVFAQTNAQSAHKFDEFGDALPTTMAALLDNFAIELQNNPKARAFLIVYRSHRDLPGLSSRHVNWMRSYLVDRGFKADRVVAIDGGEASCLSHELWIAQPGAAPTPRADAYSRRFEDTTSARKFDEYYYTIPQDMLESYSSEFENGLEGFANALRKDPRSLAYIIAYEEYRIERWEEQDENGGKKTHRRVHIDPSGTAWRELKRNKAELVMSYGILPSRVRSVNGGYRKWRQIELWIVPRGEHAPIATPNAFPAQRKKR